MPDIAIIGVTTQCNSRCSYCDIWSQPSSVTSTETILAAIGAAGDIGVKLVGFTGGEPLLVDNLESIVSRAKSVIPWVTVSTNGILLSQFRGTTLENAGLDALIVSLDTLNAHIYRKLRGISIEYVLRGIEEALAGSRHVRLAISCVVSLENLPDLPEIARYCLKKKLLLGFTPLHDVNVQLPFINKEIAAKSLKVFSKIMEEIRSLKDAGLVLVNSSEYLDALGDFLIDRKLPQGIQCPNANRSISISSDGFVRICPYMPPIGCLEETDIISMWNSDTKKEIVERMHHLDCPGCWYSYRAERLDLTWLKDT